MLDLYTLISQTVNLRYVIVQHQHIHFWIEFEEYYHSQLYEKRIQEAGGCEGCMRACWIDTSSMFRTVRETSLKPSTAT